MLSNEFCDGSVIAVYVLVKMQIFMKFIVYANGLEAEGCYYNLFN